MSQQKKMVYNERNYVYVRGFFPFEVSNFVVGNLCAKQVKP